MKRVLNRSFLSVALASALFAAVAPGCAPVDETEDTQTADENNADAIVGANAVARRLTLNGYVYVEPNASQETILSAVRMQTRTAFGPLRNLSIGLDDREIRTIDASTFVRENVSVVDTAHPGTAARPMLRVRYVYTDRAVVTNTLAGRTSVATTVLFGDYAQHGQDVITQCTDDPEAEEFGTDGLWYMFNPSVTGCQRRVRDEVTAVDASQRGLDRRTQVSAAEVSRWFLPVTVRLATISASRATRYPEYDRLLGVGDAQKTALNVYGFFGVIGDSESDPHDDGYLEMMHVLQNLRRAHPTLQFVAAAPAVDLLDLRPGGTRLANVTYDRVIDWALGAAPPSGVTRAALQAEISRVWRTRTINLTMPMSVTSGGTTRQIAFNVHAYYGDEGSAYSTAAHARYVNAWRDADLFIYSGHSHLGSGPLDPSNYRATDFPNRYQIMMINSCVSYNYYNRDFYDLHPGGSRNLDMIVNGIEALGDNGFSVSALINGVVDGRQQSYLSLVRAMVATVPEIGLDHYDPLRVVDGELDNRYTPSATPITLRTP